MFVRVLLRLMSRSKDSRSQRILRRMRGGTTFDVLTSPQGVAAIIAFVGVPISVLIPLVVGRREAEVLTRRFRLGLAGRYETGLHEQRLKTLSIAHVWITELLKVCVANSNLSYRCR